MDAEAIDPSDARKSAGRFDTPPVVARLVAALGLSSALHAASLAPDRAEAILAIRVCDPTCGEGNLLVEAVTILADALALARSASPTPRERDAARAAVVRRCVRGVERDPAVVARCRAALAEVATLSPEALVAHVALGDAAEIACAGRWSELFPDVMARGGFDAVLGNPPFLNAIERRAASAMRDSLRRLHPEIGATADLSFHFLAIADALRAPHGRAAVVMPRALLSAPAADALRERLTPSLRAVYAPDARRLFDAHVCVCVVALGPGEGCAVSDDADPDALRWTSVALGDGAWWAALKRFDRDEAAVGERLAHRFELSASMTTSEAYELAPLLIDAPEGRGLALVTTGLIDRGACGWGARECRYLKRSFAHPRVDPSRRVPPGIARRIARAARPKIIVAGLGREIECFVDERGRYLGAVSTWTITHRDDDLTALRGLAEHLHSDAVNARMRAELGATALSGGSITLTKRFLAGLRVP